MARTKTGERQKRQARAVVRDDSSDEEQEYEVFKTLKSIQYQTSDMIFATLIFKYSISFI